LYRQSWEGIQGTYLISNLASILENINKLNEMKTIIFVLVITVLIYSCKSSDKTTSFKDEPSTENQIDTVRIENEALEYKIIIIEIGFDSWLRVQKPMTFYTDSYLANRNLFYVSEWNRRVNLPGVYNPQIYCQLIDYEPSTDYGLEVNYMLFMYFEFIQDKYNQNL
jgi:hypothetical protein